MHTIVDLNHLPWSPWNSLFSGQPCLQSHSNPWPVSNESGISKDTDTWRMALINICISGGGGVERWNGKRFMSWDASWDRIACTRRLKKSGTTSLGWFIPGIHSFIHSYTRTEGRTKWRSAWSGELSSKAYKHTSNDLALFENLQTRNELHLTRKQRDEWI